MSQSGEKWEKLCICGTQCAIEVENLISPYNKRGIALERGIAVFRGVNTINLDAKGRMAMPARHREQLLSHCSGHLVATIDTNSRCLLLYPVQEWEQIQRKIESLPSFNPTSRRVQRLLIGHATDLELDNSGRILLPQTLREYAGLEKHVALIGQGKKLELWDQTNWTEQRDLWLSETDPEGELPDDLRSLSL